MTKIKICGLSRDIDIDAVNKVLPDYIGFVFAKSKRQVTPDAAKLLRERLDPSIQVVGVFVNEKIENIVKLCKARTIDIIQLHGDEDEAYIIKLRTYLSNKIIRAVRVKTVEDIRKANECSADYMLLDAFEEGAYGGSGKIFDWSAVTNMDREYFLAGGINTNNILHAIDKCNPFCIDVSSGVETDGYKDMDKIIGIVTKLRNINL